MTITAEQEASERLRDQRRRAVIERTRRHRRRLRAGGIRFTHRSHRATVSASPSKHATILARGGAMRSRPPHEQPGGRPARDKINPH